MLSTRRMRLPSVEGLTLNGVPLERMMLGLGPDGVTVDAAKPIVSVQDMPGRDGGLDLTLTDPTGAAYMDRRTITLDLYAVGGEDDILAAKTRLGALAGTIATISWRTLPGAYRGRLSLDQWDDKWAGPGMVATSVHATIDAAPTLTGPTRTTTLTNGANTVRVKGNRPCWPVWTLTPAANTRTITIRDAHGHHLTVTAATAITGRVTITTSPDTRATRINGNLTAPTLDSDYFPLLPGTDTITLTGITSGTVTHQPLTLI